MRTRVDGAPYDATEGVPGAVVKPVVEVVETLLREELGRSVVEVWIELVNDALESQHGEEARRKRWKCQLEALILVMAAVDSEHPRFCHELPRLVDQESDLGYQDFS